MKPSTKSFNLCIVPVKVTDTREYVISNFTIELYKTSILPNSNPNFELCILPNPSCRRILLWWKSSGQITEVLGECAVPDRIFESIRRSSSFILATSYGHTEINVLVIDILLDPKIFVKLNYAIEPVWFGSKRDVCEVLKYLKKNPFEGFLEMKAPDSSYVEQIYDMLYKQRQDLEIPKQNCQSPLLIPELRKYQIDAVSWMLSRENSPPHSSSLLHPLFLEYQTMDGLTVYAHKYCGFFTKDRISAAPDIRGGILADEMGLGKTVEVISLILLNPQMKSAAMNDSLGSSSDSSLLDTLSGNTTKQGVAETICSSVILPDIDESEEPCTEHDDNSNFLCVCGKVNSKKTKVICVKCGLSQHLECILSKQYYSPKGSYVCSFCMVMEKVPSRATLIVSPSVISNQWFEEIKKHTIANSVKVLCYNGVKKEKFIPPSALADNDVVIVSYETFKTELHFVGVERGSNSRRHNKKYTVLPSPLTAVNWWRICLDEAQMVEGSSTKAAQMALQLTSVNRWCVTGTPIQKSAVELYGMFLFLNYEPYTEKKWFHEVLYKPYTGGELSNLVKVLVPVFWRTMKKDVFDQIGLRPYIQVDHKMSFSSVEKYFYDRQHECCASDFCRKVEKLDPTCLLKSIDKRVLSKVMVPLKKLRQACCHPQAVKGQFAPRTKSILTMEEISESLIKKAQIECEEVHRCYVAAANGIAGLEILRDNLYEAAVTYVHLLQHNCSHEQHFKTDSLQQIHTLHNLAYVIRMIPANVFEVPKEDKTIGTLKVPGKLDIELPHEFCSLRDIEMKEAILCSSYFIKHEELLRLTVNEMRQAVQQVQELKGKIVSKNFASMPWYENVFDEATNCKKDHELIGKVKESLYYNNTLPIFMRSFTDCNGLYYVCRSLFDNLLKSRDALFNEVKELAGHPTAADVSAAAACHLRPVRPEPERGVRRCKYCLIEKSFLAYEKYLFNISQGNQNTQSKRRRLDEELEEFEIEGSSSSDERDDHNEESRKKGNWADGVLEQILKAVLNFATSKKFSREALEAGSQTVDLFGALKKEFKAFRAVWIHARDRVSSTDEIHMAKTRFRLEEQKDPSDPSVLTASMIPCTYEYLNLEKEENDQLLSNKTGRLLFLKKIAKAYMDSSGASEICPICQCPFEMKWSVLGCGHRLCVTCLSALMDQQKGLVSKNNEKVPCPVCRTQTRNSEILFLNVQNKDCANSAVKGSHSTKVFHVLDCLVKIINEDKDVKCIVFSSFDEVLKIMSEALIENEVEFIHLTAKKDFQGNLEKFKEERSCRVLLLSVRNGANGLNIVEASHVFLVEPLLNPGLRAQAISRAHRIGQQRQTYVHHFYVESTIEEKIIASESHQTFQLKDDISGNITVGEMKALFEL